MANTETVVSDSDSALQRENDALKKENERLASEHRDMKESLDALAAAHHSVQEEFRKYREGDDGKKGGKRVSSR